MKVVFHAVRAPGDSIVYQRYYQQGLRQVASLECSGLPAPVRRASAAWEQLRRRRSDAGHVGRYEVEGARFVIDARDNHVVDDHEALAWADVYFKANRWRDQEYPEHVRPVVNGNGFVGPRQIDLLRSLRGTPKELDVAFISNLWGGREHNARLFEQLAAGGMHTDLLAVLPEGADPAEDRQLAARLASSGIQVSKAQIPITELWQRLARARVVVLRSGRHLCIPWRMIDLLAMGACILFDAEPLPQWPEPLREGEHYASIGIDRPAWKAPAASEYEKVIPAVRALLADDGRRNDLSAGAVRYFEAHAAPARVAQYVLDTTMIGRR